MRENLGRLFDESDSALERTLLEAGRHYRGSPTARAKTLTALGLAGSAALTGAAASAGASLLSKSTWTKLFAISALGAAATIPPAVALWPESPAAIAPAAAAKPAAPPVSALPQPSNAGPEEAEAAAEPVPEVAQPAPRTRTTRSGAASRSSAGLTEELAALDAARSALAAGDGSRALSLLDEHARNHPRARLRLEAEVLRIDALAKSGQRAASRRRATQFLERHPNSVLATRVRSYL